MATITGTATTTKQTFAYSPTQNKLKVTNTGNIDIELNVGVFQNQTIHAQQIWENRVDFSSFEVFTNVGTCEFSAVITNDVIDIAELNTNIELINNQGLLGGIVVANEDGSNLEEADYEALPATKETDGKLYFVFEA